MSARLLAFSLVLLCVMMPAVVASPWDKVADGNVNAMAFDKERQCLWFLQNGNLAKLDLLTMRTTVILDGKAHGGVQGNCLGLDGDILWIGGNGLWKYDIPGENAMVYQTGTDPQSPPPGMIEDNILRIVIEPGRVWWYNNNYFGANKNKGLCCFNYQEEIPGRRWIHYTVQSTERNPGAQDGLASDVCRGFVSLGGGKYCVFPLADSPMYQMIDTVRNVYQRGMMIPALPAEVQACTPRDVQGTVAIGGNSITEYQIDDDAYGWFGMRVKSATPQLDGYATMYYDAKHVLHVFSANSTESRKGVRDGLTGNVVCLANSGESIWFGTLNTEAYQTRAICRYQIKSQYFTQYINANGLPQFSRINRIIPTSDAVYFATDQGIIRYQLSADEPRVTTVTPGNEKTASNVKDIVITFSLPMNSKTIQSSSIELWCDGALVDGTITYVPGQNKAVMSFPHPLLAGKEYVLVLKSLIQAENGNPISWQQYKFTTANQAD